MLGLQACTGVLHPLIGGRGGVQPREEYLQVLGRVISPLGGVTVSVKMYK